MWMNMMAELEAMIDLIPQAAWVRANILVLWLEASLAKETTIWKILLPSR